MVLHGCHLTDESLRVVSQLAAEDLDISYNTLQGAGLVHLVELPNVKNLILAGNPLTNEHLVSLTRMELEELHLGASPVTDEGVAILTGCKGLLTIDLSDTQITDAAIVSLARIETLRTVRLNRTNVTMDGVRQLQAALPGCEVEWSASQQVANPRADPAKVRQKPPKFVQSETRFRSNVVIRMVAHIGISDDYLQRTEMLAVDNAASIPADAESASGNSTGRNCVTCDTTSMTSTERNWGPRTSDALATTSGYHRYAGIRSGGDCMSYDQTGLSLLLVAITHLTVAPHS